MLKHFRPTDVKNCSASSKLYVSASKVAGGVEALGGGDRQIRLAKKGEKRGGEKSPDRGVGRKAGVQVTTYLNEDLGSNGVFLARGCS